MANPAAEFDTYVFLGDPAMPPLWRWSAWQQVAPAMDPVIQAARGPASVRSTQNLPQRAGTVKFGRIGWKEADHQKWTHESPRTLAESSTWEFLNAEVWAPAWTQCEREHWAPDVFLSISNEAIVARAVSFNPVVVFAVATDLAQRNGASLAGAISRLAELLAPKLSGFVQRPWGRSVRNVGFTNAIQDLHISGLFKPGDRHKKPVALDMLSGTWQPLIVDRSDR